MTTTAERPVIELPREPGESNRAYEMRREYVTMGPSRSIDKLRQNHGKTTATYTRQLEGWSSQYGWVACARKYDDEMTLIAIQEASDAYRRDLEDHRKRYGDAGKALYQVAAKLLKQLDGIAGQTPKTIEGRDGKWYKVPGIELTPATLTVASRAMTIAADLEAHALRLGDILPKLDHDVQD
jgi:hypothetical protein